MLYFIDPLSLGIGYIIGILLCWSITKTLYSNEEEG